MRDKLQGEVAFFAGLVTRAVLKGLIYATVVWRGWCLHIIWNWFAPEPLARLTTGGAVGLLILFGFFLSHKSPAKGDDTEGWRPVAYRTLLAPAISLGLAWLAHTLIGGAS